MATNYFEMMRDVVGSYGDGLDLARARQRADADDAWKAQERTRQQSLWDRADKQYNDVETARTSLDALRGGVYDGSKGLNIPTVDAPDGPARMPADLPQPTSPATGLAPSRRSATPLEMNAAHASLASANRDFATLAGLDEKRVGLQWDADYAGHLKAYKGTPEQVDQVIKHVNTSSKSLTFSDPDGKGNRSVMIVGRDGKGVLSSMTEQDQQQIYAASMMLDQNPMKALQIMAGVNKDVAAAVAADNGLLEKVADLQIKGRDSDTRRFAAESLDRYHQGSLGLSRERNAQAALSEKMGAAKYFQGEDGQTYASIPTMSKTGGLQFQTVRVNPDGVKMADLKAKAPAELQKLPEDGTRVKDAKGNVYTYNEGEPIISGGIPKAGRTKFMSSIGLPPQAESYLEWMPGGRYVRIPGDSDSLYDVAEPRDAILVKAAVARWTDANAAETERRARGGITRNSYGTNTEAVMRGNAAELARHRRQLGMPLTPNQ